MPVLVGSRSPVSSVPVRARRDCLAVALGVSLGVGVAAPSAAQHCSSSTPLTGLAPLVPGNLDNIPLGCGAVWCGQPEVVGGVEYRTVPAGCNPRETTCEVRAYLPFQVPGNHQMPTNTHFRAFFFNTGEAPDCAPATPPPSPFNCTGGQQPMSHCGFLGAEVIVDLAEAWIRIPSFYCNPSGTPTGGVSGAYSFSVYSCWGAGNCRKVDKNEDPILLTAEAVAEDLCRPPPPPCDGCACSIGGGAGPGGGPGGGSGPPGGADNGPGALLRHHSGGVGHPTYPGSSVWRTTLGRYWSHSYAHRIAEDPDETHVWLLDGGGTFTEWSNLDGGGEYLSVNPSDEYRTLRYTGSGWELSDLEGGTAFFLADGRWDRTEDRSGNTTQATYDGSNRLIEVAFPDERTETFAYHPSGKLATITENPVPGSAESPLVWSYTWLFDDLVRVVRPDGSELRYFYAEPRHAGYLTMVKLVRDNLDPMLVVERVLLAREFDDHGNVVRVWRGVEDPDLPEDPEEPPGPSPVDLFELSYDDPVLPAETTVTDALGKQTVYHISRDPAGTKMRIDSVTGDCPICGFGPATEFEYDDPDHPLLPTATVDAGGVRTELEYDEHGRVVSRLEAVGLAEERLTTWEYHADFPAFVTERSQAGVTVAQARVETFAYDSVTGDLESGTLQGFEGTYPTQSFQLTTSFTYDPDSGALASTDPPGHSTSDATTWSYVPDSGDAERGKLFPFLRTDPLIGSTRFEYDGFNRRTAEVDPNGTRTETTYDELDRVVSIRACQVAVPSEPCGSAGLVTAHTYGDLGDLERTVLPRGNLSDYAYDHAGRLVEVHRRPDASTNGERAVYALDAFGNRVQETHQRWNGSAWVTDASTSYVYDGRCQLVGVSSGSSLTEHAYDCEGRLVETWDGNHPSEANGPTQLYLYDNLDRLKETRQPWTPSGLPCTLADSSGCAVTEYAYDVQDHLIQVTDAEGNVTLYDYSDRDLLTEEQGVVLDPDGVGEQALLGTKRFAYDDHGALVEEEEVERGVTVTRTVDVLDRVTFVDYDDDSLDIDYDWDDAATNGLGRLRSIERNGEAVLYAYDGFGRLTQDGALGYGYDDNGNRTTVGYSGGITATYGFDFADRASTLSVDAGSGAQAVVQSASYAASGPLTGLVLGNGAVEARGFDSRYSPTMIGVEAAAEHNWAYQTDGVGNILEVASSSDCQNELLLENQTVSTNETFEACLEISAGPAFRVEPPAEVVFRAGSAIALRAGFSVGSGGATFRAQIAPVGGSAEVYTYEYQPPQYFLAAADGPRWGELDWTYDRIGNRLSEERSGLSGPEAYVYLQNDASPTPGNTPILDTVAVVRDYTYGTSGHLEEVDADGNVVDFLIDDAARTARISRPIAGGQVDFLYDGRGYLRLAQRLLGGGPDTGFTEPTYGSEGVLLSVRRVPTPSSAEEHASIFYFGDRPVAQLERVSGGSSTWTYLTTDHLGTPLLATDANGDAVWQGPFEPLGRDSLAGTATGALENGILLRLPGQWEDRTWTEPSSGAGVFYNVARWYQPGIGKFTRPDPLGLLLPDEELNSLLYASSRPTSLIDPDGLEPKPPNGKWCDERPEACPEECDPEKLMREIASNARLERRYCDAWRTGVGPGRRRGDPQAEGGVETGRAWYVPRTPSDECSDACICAHEEKHVEQLPYLVSRALELFGKERARYRLECDAYQAGSDCLIDLALGRRSR